ASTSISARSASAGSRCDPQNTPDLALSALIYPPSLPGLTRQSIFLKKRFSDGCAGHKRVYARLRRALPAHDEWRGFLRRKPEMHDVPAGDDIGLALEPHLARLLRAGLAAERHIIVVGDGLGADEAALEVGMDDGRRLRRLGSARDRPGRRLLGAGGEIGDQIEQRIAGANQSVEARLLEPDRGQIFGALVRRQHRDLRLDLGRDDDASRAFLARARLDAAREVVAGCGGGLVDVAHVEHRYGGQEAEHAKGLLLL